MFTLTADPIWLKTNFPLLHPNNYILQRFFLKRLRIPDLEMLQLFFLCLFSFFFNLRLYFSLVLFSFEIVFCNPLFIIYGNVSRWLFHWSWYYHLFYHLITCRHKLLFRLWPFLFLRVEIIRIEVRLMSVVCNWRAYRGRCSIVSAQ